MYFYFSKKFFQRQIFFFGVIDYFVSINLVRFFNKAQEMFLVYVSSCMDMGVYLCVYLEKEKLIISFSYDVLLEIMVFVNFIVVEERSKYQGFDLTVGGGSLVEKNLQYILVFFGKGWVRCNNSVCFFWIFVYLIYFLYLIYIKFLGIFIYF